MFLNKNLNTKFIKACLITATILITSTTSADDFRILNGTFFMATVSDSISVLEPGNNTGILSEGIFQGVTPTGPYPNNPVNRNVDSNQVLFAPFPFFGQPVGTYTAATGVDGVTHAAPSIDLTTGVADMGAFYAYWNGTEFNQGNTNATVIDNFDGTYKLFWSSLIVGGPFNGKTGDWVMVVECLTCPPSTAGTSVGLSASQGGFTTRTVTQDAGNFTVSTDLASTTGYTFNWSPTDDAVDDGAVITTPTMTIDPSMIPVGTYLIKVNISNNNTDPIEKSASTFLINVVTTGIPSDIGDVDNDGVPNNADTIADPRMLQTQDGNNASFIMTSDVGKLTLGNVAICSGQSSASVTASDIKNNAGTGCIAVANASDVLGEVKTGIGGYYDFAVRSLIKGSLVQVVIPLSEPLATNAGYRSYSFVDGWKPFATSQINEDIDKDNNFDNINELTGEDIDGDGNLDVDEDTNGNGILDPGEDIDGDGNLDVDEDTNNNGILELEQNIDIDGNQDTGEDINANGILDAGEDIDGDGVLDLTEDLNSNNKFDADAVFSAKGTSGNCPAAADDSWTAGLTQGNNCILLKIADGGANDSDGQPNGIVTSTGTMIGYAGINSDLLSEGCSISGNPGGLREHIEWLLLAGFILWLGYRGQHRTEA